ncbi:MAG TPA: amidohydrolase family protein [Rhizomicrobium sp.]|nr:amidohydrolase family protein [Rhizomicrobium sp.]
MLRRIALFSCLLAAPAIAQTPAAKPSIVVYEGVTVIDGTGAAAKPGMAIIARDGRIDAIVPKPQWRRKLGAKLAAAAGVVDLNGDYALPGLIDTHVHLATDPDPVFEQAQLRRFIYSGVTTVRDMAGDTRVLNFLARQTLLHKMDGPDVYYAALMAGPQFFRDPRTIASAQGAVPGAVPWMQAMTDDADIPLAVARAKGTDATALKLYADMPGELDAKITREAHRQHMLVWGHAATFPASPMEVVDAGEDVVSHACMLAYQASDRIPPEYHNRAPVDDAKFANGSTAALDPLLADMKAHQTILDATIYVYKVMWDEAGPKSPPPYCKTELAARITRAAHQAGIDVSTGTDADSDWDKPLPSVFDEIALLVNDAGFTPLEAIRAATLVGAKTVGQEKTLGSLEAGKRANILFVAKDPLADIQNLRMVVLTVKDAQEFWRNKYPPITKDEAKSTLQ